VLLSAYPTFWLDADPSELATLAPDDFMVTCGVILSLQSLSNIVENLPDGPESLSPRV
jgi:hypothetical protein